jgi:hypothetical protein
MKLSRLTDISSSKESLRMVLRSAEAQSLKPLVEESVELLGLDGDQVAEMEARLRDAWFFGIRTGHRVMVQTKMGQEDPAPVLAGMQDEFQALMERLADALNTTVGATITAWNFLGRAWIAGAKFWEVEIAARLIESSSSDLEEALRRLR